MCATAQSLSVPELPSLALHAFRPSAESAFSAPQHTPFYSFPKVMFLVDDLILFDTLNLDAVGRLLVCSPVPYFPCLWPYISLSSRECS